MGIVIFFVVSCVSSMGQSVEKLDMFIYSVELKLCVNVSNCDCPKSPNCLWSDKFDNKTLPETPNGFIRSWRPCVKNSNLSWNCQKPKVSVSLPKFTNKVIPINCEFFSQFHDN